MPIQPRFGSWTRPSGLSWGALARRDDAAAPASAEKQRRQGAPGRLNRVRSALTQRVNLIGAKKFNHFMVLLRFKSGQLRNLGSSRHNRRRAGIRHHTGKASHVLPGIPQINGLLHVQPGFGA